jgi:trimethylamine--corrinoid protein Co-methyltransferase
LPALAGANIIYGLGMLEMGVTFSLEQLLMDADMANMIMYAIGGIPVNDETLSLDVIKQNGYKKDFLTHRNTFANRFIQSSPKLIDRRTRSRWLEDEGGLDMCQRAKKQFKHLYENYQPAPLSIEAHESIRRIVNETEAGFSLPPSEY